MKMRTRRRLAYQKRAALRTASVLRWLKRIPPLRADYVSIWEVPSAWEVTSACDEACGDMQSIMDSTIRSISVACQVPEYLLLGRSAP